MFTVEQKLTMTCDLANKTVPGTSLIALYISAYLIPKISLFYTRKQIDLYDLRTSTNPCFELLFHPITLRGVR